MFLADDNNRRLVATLVQVARVHKDWHTVANKEFRFCQKAREWLLAQHEGAYMGHLNAVKHVLLNPSAMLRPYVCRVSVVRELCVFVAVCD